jgi:hypothetical protein
MLRALLARRQDSRTQFTSAIIAQSIMRNQLHAINHASVEDTYVDTLFSRENLTNRSILLLKLL